MSSMEIEEIMSILPHRYPMLLVDRVLECDVEKQTIVGVKNVTVNEPFFQGHFPGMPVMPGVLQLEAMAQTGGVLIGRVTREEGVTPYFMTIDKVKFRRVVKPGDQMRIEAQITHLRAKVAKIKARVLVDGVVASQAELGCAFSRGEAPPSV